MDDTSAADEWVGSVHYNNGISCERCHSASVPAGRLARFDAFGGSYRADHVDLTLNPDIAYKAPSDFPIEGKPGEYSTVVRGGLTKQQSIAVCARCHGLTPIDVNAPKNVFPDYAASVHGQSVMVRGLGDPSKVSDYTGLTDAAVCVDCHDPHATTSKDDPASSTYNDNIIPTCEKCHGSEEIADKYGMTNAFEGWEENIMFRRGMIGEEGIPTCVDCHLEEGGTPHKIVGIDNPASPVNVENRAETCGKKGCHPAFKDKGAFNVPIHLTFPPDKAKYFPEWVTFRFMEILLIGTMGLFIPLFGLDIIRKFEERGKGGEHK
ncbi:hypothetical protein BMS3Bbin16_00187 [archaeon BMS3Bbin16]|nr:hypothetical protein BMS3Bbin16_00187 [archaeon BMS3Bbin16]